MKVELINTDGSYLEKFKIIQDFISSEKISGNLIDIGSRNEILKNYLKDENLKYFSADIAHGKDFTINLEEKLPLDDNQFNVVTALDVLEHVENIHFAFSELSRITSDYLVITLPSFSSISRRLTFLFKGHLGSGKYDLLPHHQGDRHRWLTVYKDLRPFIIHQCDINGLEVQKSVEEISFSVPGIVLSKYLNLNSLFCERITYILKKKKK